MRLHHQKSRTTPSGALLVKWSMRAELMKIASEDIEALKAKLANSASAL